MQTSASLHRRMTSGRIPTLILQIALPNTIGLLVVAAYSLADSFFVSHLGPEASAAVGVAFAIHVLMQAVGYTLGMGAGSLLSRSLGKKQVEEASFFASVAFFLALLCGVLITVPGLIFRESIIRFLGATETNFPYALSYVTPLFWSAPFMCATFVLSQLLRAEGKAVASMVGLFVGSGCNILLDPLLITYFDLGIAGASVATLISQCVSALTLLSAYVFHRSHLNLFLLQRQPFWRCAGRILVAGLPSLFRQGLSGISAILLNRVASIAGDAALIAISAVSRIFLLVFSFCLGIGQGMMPVIGYNHGAKDHQRIRAAYRFSVLSATIVMFLFSIPLFLWSPQILSWFQNDSEVIRIGTFALRAQSAVLFTHGIATCTILYLQAVGKQFLGTVLASARQGIFFLPLIFLIPKYFGLAGVQLTQPICDALTFLFTIPFALYANRCIKRQL